MVSFFFQTKWPCDIFKTVLLDLVVQLNFSKVEFLVHNFVACCMVLATTMTLKFLQISYLKNIYDIIIIELMRTVDLLNKIE